MKKIVIANNITVWILGTVYILGMLLDPELRVILISAGSVIISMIVKVKKRQQNRQLEKLKK